MPHLNNYRTQYSSFSRRLLTTIELILYRFNMFIYSYFNCTEKTALVSVDMHVLRERHQRKMCYIMHSASKF